MRQHASWIRRPNDPTTPFGWLIRLRRDDAWAHASLPTVGSGDEPYAVTMLLYDRGRLTGREHGWLSLADGWLVYEGLRTGFSIKPTSVDRPRVREDGALFRLVDGRVVEFRLAPRTLREQANRRRHLYLELEDWVYGPSPIGEAVFPPRERHPEAARDAVAKPLIVFAALALATIGMGIVAPEWVWTTALPDFVFLTIGLRRLTVFRRELPDLMRSGVELRTTSVGAD